MRLILTLILFASCLVSSGQAANQVFTPDSTVATETIYFTGTKEASIYQGVSGFCFTAEDSSTVILQGCYDTDQWYDIDTVTTTADISAGYNIYQTPPLWKYYRLKNTGIGTDTCNYTNVRHYLKY